jgi:ubiquinone/menaquinone biosynthesis C-methylase UbiE
MDEHVCPWWLGYFLVNPLRRLWQNPEDILRPYTNEGMTVLDIGCAMGFFTLPMARIVGEKGRVIAVDLQERMIRTLRRRAKRANLLSRIETRVCSSRSLGIDDLAESIDFALAFAVLHEMPDLDDAVVSIAQTLKPGGLSLIAEPKSHISRDDFEKEISCAKESGLDVMASPDIWKSYSAVMRKK